MLACFCLSVHGESKNREAGSKRREAGIGHVCGEDQRQVDAGLGGCQF